MTLISIKTLLTCPRRRELTKVNWNLWVSLRNRKFELSRRLNFFDHKFPQNSIDLKRRSKVLSCPKKKHTIYLNLEYVDFYWVMLTSSIILESRRKVFKPKHLSNLFLYIVYWELRKICFSLLSNWLFLDGEIKYGYCEVFLIIEHQKHLWLISKADFRARICLFWWDLEEYSQNNAWLF